MGYFVPERYDLAFRINKTKTKITARVEITGEVKQGEIRLHSVDLDVKNVLVDNVETDHYRCENGELLIPELENGTHTVIVNYSFVPTANMEGAYLSTYRREGKEERLISTQFESHYARECFPCVDEPAAKAVFKLKITSEDPEDTILSNMPCDLITREDDCVIATFPDTPRMSTYLVAFCVGKFHYVETKSKHGVRIRSYACLNQPLEDLKYSADFAAEVLDFYDDCFKTPFPLPKMDLIAIPDFEAGAMENWGLVTYREIAMLANEDSSLEQKLYVCTVVAHELSHMWFGDLVTMEWWNDLWLNESFANMMEAYAVDKLRPELGAWDDFDTSVVLSALRRDCLPGVQPVRVDVANVEDIANLFDGAIVYAKGSRLMRMLMRIMGEDNFFAGLVDYFAEHKYQNTTADDLWDALSKHADFDVKEFMTPWLVQSGYPVVDAETGEQHRFLLGGEGEDYRYPIRELMDDLSGHYLIKLSETALDEKLAHLSDLSKEQKLRLLIDRRYLAKTSEVSSASLFKLLEAFKNETDAVIWDMLSVIVNDLKIFFDPHTEEKRAFQRRVGDIARDQFKRLGVVAKANDSDNDRRLRATIMGLMRFSKDEDFEAQIEDVYAKQDITKVDTDLRWVVAAALLRENNSLSPKYFNIYCTSVDASLKQDIGGALAASRDRDTLKGYLPKLMDGTIRPQDRFGFYYRLVGNYVSQDDALDWMFANWDWLVKEEGDKTIADYTRYVAAIIRQEEPARRYREFFEPKIDQPALTRDIKVGLADIEAKLQLIKEDQPAVFKELGF